MLPPVADLHCDTAAWLDREPRGDITATRGQVSLPRLEAGGVALQIFALWADPRAGRPRDAARRQAEVFRERILEASGGRIRQARTRAEVDSHRAAGAISGILAMEGADGLGETASGLADFVERGLRILSLTWNNSNAFADGLDAPTPAPRGGLTPEGERLLGAMAAARVIADLSHAHPETFWDVITTIPGPVIASHANARGVLDHRRNLDDEQLLAIARKEGVIGLVYYAEFVRGVKRSRAADLLAHYRYVVDIAGEGAVALGSDFGSPGMRMAEGLRHPGDVPGLLRLFRKAGVGERALGLLALENVLRVLRTADERYHDIPPLDWRPLPVLPVVPRSAPALYDRLRSTSRRICEPMEKLVFQADGPALFAVAFRVRSHDGEGIVRVRLRVSGRGPAVEAESDCPLDGSRCLVELPPGDGSPGSGPAEIAAELFIKDAPPRLPCWRIQDVVPLGRVLRIVPSGGAAGLSAQGSGGRSGVGPSRTTGATRMRRSQPGASDTLVW
ncbi:MAG: membrane dipeptidase [Deltaproteobacteria bacterium]|nr:membrane dipeptidase [Deltaproteobacteria bacterium]